MMALACLDLLQSSGASIWFFAAILTPCTEIVRVIVNRLLKKPFCRSSHVHNKVFAALKHAGALGRWLTAYRAYCQRLVLVPPTICRDRRALTRLAVSHFQPAFWSTWV